MTASHPACPSLPLVAGEALPRGTVAWIDERGVVRASRPITRNVYDGLVAAEASAGAPVCLTLKADLSVRTRAIIDALHATVLE